jgi:hypothetical protein
VRSLQANAAISGRFAAIQPQRREIWFGWDGSGRLRETDGTPRFMSAADLANWKAAGSPRFVQAGRSDIAYGRGCLTMSNLAALPTDPTALRAQLTARKIEGGPPGPAEDFVQVGDLLRETNASAALRFALYEIASNLPGVRVLPHVTDHAGRTGIGLMHGDVDRGLQDELIIDPATKTLLGTQQRIAGPRSGLSAPIGTVISWAVYLRSGIVNHLPHERPTGQVRPLPASRANAAKLPQPNPNRSATPAAPGGCSSLAPAR